MFENLAALDLWSLFVDAVFGSFLLAVLGLGLVMFVIMGVLGRISIYSVTWYLIMFAVAMALGYGIVIVNILIFIILLIGVYFSWKSYFDSK